MKKFYIFVLTILISVFAFATPVITAVQNGTWDNKNTWDKARVPQNGETIVIPAGKTVTLDKSVSISNVDLQIAGVLQLDGGNIGLFGFFSTPVVFALDKNSTINILLGGSLNGTGTGYVNSPYQIIKFGGNQVYSNLDGQINGTKIMNLTGIFGFTTLPVKFESFAISATKNSVLVQWSVSQEENVNTYQVERSVDGTTWSTIAYVAPIGGVSTVKSYSYSDKNILAKKIYYRIQEVDLDGSRSYSSIQSAHMDVSAAVSNIKIAAVQSKVLLQFPTELKGPVMIRFVSLSGQVMEQQMISNPQGQVILSSKLTGNYIISVSNGKSINTAKHVIL